MVIQVRGRPLDSVPDSLDEFFDANPEIGIANLLLTELDHTSMWREEVLFIKQRQQATSDYRENQKVRWIGSHAALTCHICVMRHTVTGVGSIGHFDNFCCWQFGEESSAHRDGIQIMLDEIAFLSDGSSDGGLVEVSIVGGYEDERGDAAKNSISLLHALHDDPRTVELRHFCVGPYNTKASEPSSEVRNAPCLNLGTPKTAVLKGIALDLKSQIIFPAIFDWGQFSDFQKQLQDRVRVKYGGIQMDTEDIHKTADSTFKPKSLRNRAKEKFDKLQKEKEDREKREKRLRGPYGDESPFRVSLRPTGINENGAFSKGKTKTRLVNFKKLEKRKSEP